VRVAAETREMSSRSPSTWLPEAVSGDRSDRPDSVRPGLAERLAAVVADRASSSESVVLETAEALFEWVLEKDPAWTFGDAGVSLEEGLAAWREAHAWRGAASLFLDALRAAWRFGEGLQLGGDRDASPRAVLLQELGLWLSGARRDGAESAGGDVAWDGMPLAPGLRLARREALAARVLGPQGRGLTGRGEVIFVPSFSETVCLALEAANGAGLAPEAVLPEGAPGLEGRRGARRLAAAGVKVRYVYDAELAGLLARADRVWLGTEAIGVEGFLGRVGTRLLCEEAERREVPVLLLATSDKLVPGGALELPAWGRREDWLLWEDAPAGVRLEPQPYEIVPHELCGGILTEGGLESAATLSMRRLRVEPQPPCAPPALPAELRNPMPDSDEP
jgi:hypothetical protein